MHLLSRNAAWATRPYWRALILRGICAIIFGILAIVWPRLTFLIFLFLFGVYAILQGLILIANAYYVRQAPSLGDYSHASVPPGTWWVMAAEGALSVLCGILSMFVPRVSSYAALYVVAFWALFTGIGALASTRARGWLMGVVGVLAILISLFLFFEPLGVVRTVLWLVGVFALIAGALLIVQGWMERSAEKASVVPDMPPL